MTGDPVFDAEWALRVIEENDSIVVRDSRGWFVYWAHDQATRRPTVMGEGKTLLASVQDAVAKDKKRRDASSHI